MDSYSCHDSEPGSYRDAIEPTIHSSNGLPNESHERPAEITPENLPTRYIAANSESTGGGLGTTEDSRPQIKPRSGESVAELPINGIKYPRNSTSPLVTSSPLPSPLDAKPEYFQNSSRQGSRWGKMTPKTSSGIYSRTPSRTPSGTPSKTPSGTLSKTPTTETTGANVNGNGNIDVNVKIAIDERPEGKPRKISSSHAFNEHSKSTPKTQSPQVQQDIQGNNQVDYHFKLISVAFKEAALDSPSFRASVNHLDAQLGSTEKWLQAITALLMKIPKQAKDLLSLFLYLEYLVPSFLQDGIVDQEYTLTALRDTRDGLQLLWSIAQSALQINLPSIDAWEKTLIGRMNKYKRLRLRFNKCQRKYDHFLGIHMSMLKGKDPALLLEDLQQLAVVRNEYLKASLDIVVELSEVSQFVNRQLISFVYKIWQEKLEKLGDNPFVLALFSDVWDKIKRIHCWSESHRLSSLKMSQDMIRAKKNIQEHSIALLAPSKRLEDYKSDYINQRILEDIAETSTEKHGYLFMKTYTEKSKQPIWVRRWAFLQGGVLGFFVLDPSLTSVQETDKIGVLLCNVKYSPNEERNFCFEVKTIDTTIVLQAETLYELKSWLKVFSNIGNRIVDENDSMHALLKVASGRYPPLVLEFQSTANTTTDRDLTHSKIIASSGQVITSSKLSSHLEKNEAFFQKYIYDQIGRICLPFVTETTRSALVAHSLTGSTVVPSALSANIWGSLNWGLYYLYEPSEGLEESLKGLEDPNAYSGVESPKDFPNAWAARDVQLKALFESAVEPGEFCLLSYHCLLSPNSNQSLRGTHFVTQRHVYSYVQSLGFISLSKIPLGRIIEASVARMQDHDVLKLSLMLGLLKMKLFLDDCRLVEKKLNLLLKNYSSDQRLGISDVIKQLVEIEEAHTEVVRQDKFHMFTAPESKMPPSSIDFQPLKSVSSSSNLLDFPDAMPFVMAKEYDIPPQALLHILFGSKSRVFMDLYQVWDVRLAEKTSWLKLRSPDNYLEREFELNVLFFNGKPGKIVITQTIEKFVENEYYSIKVKNSTFKMKYGPVFDFRMRIIIQQTTEGQSMIKFYGETNVIGSYIAKIAPKYLGDTILPLFFTEMSRRVKDSVKQIGPKGKIARANYLFGRIPVTESLFVPKQTFPILVDNGAICNWCIQIKVRTVARSLHNMFRSVLELFSGFLRKLSVHGLLLGIIFCLALSNFFFGFRSSAHYWKTRQVSRLVNEILEIDPITIHRAVYSKDVEDYANQNMTGFNDSACFSAFKDQSVVLNPDKLYEWTSGLGQEEGDEKARVLKRRLREIALERNQLLLSLAALNQMEQEIAKTEWMDWLYSESLRCNEMERSGLFYHKEEHLSRPILDKLDQYCGSCALELGHLKNIL